MEVFPDMNDFESGDDVAVANRAKDDVSFVGEFMGWRNDDPSTGEAIVMGPAHPCDPSGVREVDEERLLEPKPELPDDPSASLPDYRRLCPNCEADETIAEMTSTGEQVDERHYRIDYWCTECQHHVGTNLDYDGPTPVRTHNGWEEH